jgi:lysophospholipase L1-like esterase
MAGEGKNMIRRGLVIALAVLFSLAIASACLTAGDAQHEKPIRIVLVGDSTVASYPNPPQDRPDLTGWGQVFGECFNDRVTVLNHAQSGRSTKSFMAEGLWQQALDAKGDYVFIQFGHNDSHTKDGKPIIAPEAAFPDYLRQYIDQSRAAGAKPILVTPVARRTFVGGKIHTSLQPYDALFGFQSGHDAKVWTNDSFRRLMAQGIRWAGGRVPGAEEN